MTLNRTLAIIAFVAIIALAPAVVPTAHAIMTREQAELKYSQAAIPYTHDLYREELYNEPRNTKVIEQFEAAAFNYFAYLTPEEQEYERFLLVNTVQELIDVEERAQQVRQQNLPQTPEEAQERITPEQFQQQFTELKQQTTEQP